MNNLRNVGRPIGELMVSAETHNSVSLQGRLQAKGRSTIKKEEKLDLELEDLE
jgi:hypothetical protein